MRDPPFVLRQSRTRYAPANAEARPTRAARSIDARAHAFDDAAMRLFRPLFFLLAALAFASATFADDATDASKFFDSAKAQLADMRRQLAGKDVDSALLDALRGQNNDLIAQAQALVAERTPALVAIDARATALGAEPAAGVREAPDIAAQRKDIERERATGF